MLLLDPAYYLFTRHAVAVLIVGAGILFLGTFVVVRERASRVAVKYWLLTISMSLWLVPYGMAYAARQEATVLRWFQLGTLGVAFIPPALLSLAAFIVQRERDLRPLIRLCAAASLLFAASVFATNGFIQGLSSYPWGPAAAYGRLGVLFIAYFYGVGAYALVLFVREYRVSTHPKNRRRLVWILSAFGVGNIASLDFAVNLGVPFYPMGYLPIAAYVLASIWLSIYDRMLFITPELAANQILDTMQGAVVVVDLEGKVRVVNRNAQEMLGHGKADLLGRDLSSLEIIPAELHRVVLDGQRPPPRETVWTGRDGRAYTVNLSASLVRDDRVDAPMGVVYVAHDITERTRAAERLKLFARELQEANRKLETLDRMKSDFVSVVSHELRTPLTSIKAFVELLIMRPAMEPEKKARLLHIINDESDRLGRLISDLLDLSRIESGTVAWRSEDFSLSAVIETTANGILPLARNKGVRLTTALDGALPIIRGDRDRLVQVMTNLLSNAVKFTPPGGSISVSARREEEPHPQVVVSVADTGVGIPEEDLPQIFDKFHRAQGPLTDVTEGIGLGLTIVRQIVEHHGGRIRAASTHGAGSTFTFTIPLDSKPGELGPPSGSSEDKVNVAAL